MSEPEARRARHRRPSRRSRPSASCRLCRSGWLFRWRLLARARIAHHLEADDDLHVARRAALGGGLNALRALAGGKFRPILFELLARSLFAGDATFNGSAL